MLIYLDRAFNTPSMVVDSIDLLMYLRCAIRTKWLEAHLLPSEMWMGLCWMQACAWDKGWLSFPQMFWESCWTLIGTITFDVQRMLCLGWYRCWHEGKLMPQSVVFWDTHGIQQDWRSSTISWKESWQKLVVRGWPQTKGKGQGWHECSGKGTQPFAALEANSARTTSFVRVDCEEEGGYKLLILISEFSMINQELQISKCHFFVEFQ